MVVVRRSILLAGLVFISQSILGCHSPGYTYASSTLVERLGDSEYVVQAHILQLDSETGEVRSQLASPKIVCLEGQDAQASLAGTTVEVTWPQKGTCSVKVLLDHGKIAVSHSQWSGVNTDATHVPGGT